MKFTLVREQFLKSLQQVTGALNGKPSLPILGNILLKVSASELSMTCTDLEVELIAKFQLDGDYEQGVTTVPSRKFVDICRALPEGARISFGLSDERAVMRSGRSRFTFATLPASEYPNINEWQTELEFTVLQGKLRQLIDSTAFSMANQDVRYFLNGMLLETKGNTLRAVSTDGHRMALASIELDAEHVSRQVILPRKGVIELARLLDNPEGLVTIQIGSANLRANVNQYVFTSKLVDGRFPDYHRVIPQTLNKYMLANRNELRYALSRVAVLSNEKFRGVRLNFAHNQMRIFSQNPEQEEAEEFLDIDYPYEELEIGFNVKYLLDVLNTLKNEQVHFSMCDGATSALIKDSVKGNDNSAIYVVMPIRL